MVEGWGWLMVRMWTTHFWHLVLPIPAPSLVFTLVKYYGTIWVFLICISSWHLSSAILLLLTACCLVRRVPRGQVTGKMLQKSSHSKVCLCRFFHVNFPVSSRLTFGVVLWVWFSSSSTESAQGARNQPYQRPFAGDTLWEVQVTGNKGTGYKKSWKGRSRRSMYMGYYGLTYLLQSHQ